MDIIKAYATNNLCYIAAQEMVPRGIVVHSTGANNPMLKRYVDCPDEVGVNKYGNHWNQAKPGGRKVCVHAFIGYDKSNEVRVAEILPLNICCWGVGKGRISSFNDDPAYIQFEICEDGLKDAVYYRKVFDVAIRYSAYLCKKFGLPIENIVGHCEAHRLGYGSNHADPVHWMQKFGDTMDDFRRAVSEILSTEDLALEDKEDSTKKEDATTQCFSHGDLVSISPEATYYNGQSIPSWVKQQRWYVNGAPNGDRVVIDKNEKGTSAICSPIHKKFLTLVKSEKESPKEESAVDYPFTPYLVKVTANCLYIRKGAGTNTAKVGSITDKGVYTIVEERTGVGATLWGRLKSGAGWISLDYTQKL